MSVCIGCRENKEIQERNLCAICVEWEKRHLEEINGAQSVENTCTQCGYFGAATDLHHVHGRKNSEVVIRVCCNCHREIHSGVRELVYV